MRLFEATDLATINFWYDERGLATVPDCMVPKLGLIEPDVAAGFLYRTDAPGLCFLDGFIANPRAALRVRTEALGKIVAGLLDEAERMGIPQVMALCSSRGVERLAGRAHLQPIGWLALYAKDMR